MKNDRFSQRKALPDRYFTMKEVSAIMQADEVQIKSWIEAGRLHIVHFDNEPRISEAELNEFIDQCRRSGELREVQRQ